MLASLPETQASPAPLFTLISVYCWPLRNVLSQGFNEWQRKGKTQLRLKSWLVMEGGAVGPTRQDPSRATVIQRVRETVPRDPGFLSITKETCIWPRTYRLHPTNAHSLYPIPEWKGNPAGASVQVQPSEDPESVNNYSLHRSMCTTAYQRQILMSLM